MIALDGYEVTLADAMMNRGQLPSLATIKNESARYLLDHGLAKDTGLAWEHVSSGLAPRDADRWSAVFFDKQSYEVWQEGCLFAPFPSKLRAKTVVFDFPYFDISKAGRVRGAVGWGAHDPGVVFSTSPKELLDEILERYGVYPASPWLYGFAWPSTQRCRTMGAALAEGVALRSKLALWLLKERLPDWELALIYVSELHSAAEALWHGIDEQHPLHSHPSSRAAADGVQNVYQEMDRLIGTLTAEFEDATILLFSMHGMGPNRSDVPGMVLLPELLHRYAFGRSFFAQPEAWTLATNGIPILSEEDDWHVSTPELRSISKRAAAFLPDYVKKPLKRMLRAQNDENRKARGEDPSSEAVQVLAGLDAGGTLPVCVAQNAGLCATVIL